MRYRFMDISQINQLAIALRANWKSFPSFCWHMEDCFSDPENWTIIYTHNRDSALLAQSNADTIKKRLEPFFKGEDDDGNLISDIYEEEHGHWAVGWVAGYSIRVYSLDWDEISQEIESKYTPAFIEWCRIAIALDSYPILDEDDYSEKEYEATRKNLIEVGRRFVKDDASEDWLYQVWAWFEANNLSAIESSDDQGGYPNDDEMKEALAALNLLHEYYLEEVQV